MSTQLPPPSPQQRRLQDCPAVLLIVYTVGADADARGYEPWLVRVDNPFFNAIPGVRHYANWRVERVLRGGPLPFTHFDFQGLDSDQVLEPVWFNEDLDGFRKEWIRLWGYGSSAPDPVLANAYLMHPAAAGAADGAHCTYARVAGGRGGAPQPGTDLAWRVDETIRKHFAAPAGGTSAWRSPTTESNPLGLDWLSVTYGDSTAALEAGYVPGAEAVAFTARLIAAPSQDL